MAHIHEFRQVFELNRHCTLPGGHWIAAVIPERTMQVFLTILAIPCIAYGHEKILQSFDTSVFMIADMAVVKS